RPASRTRDLDQLGIERVSNDPRDRLGFGLSQLEALAKAFVRHGLATYKQEGAVLIAGAHTISRSHVLNGARPEQHNRCVLFSDSKVWCWQLHNFSDPDHSVNSASLFLANS